jgi:two-component system, LytTR family, response regulator
MQIAICDDEKSIGLILEEKIKKLLPDAVIDKYLSGDELIASGCEPDILFSEYSDARNGWNGNGKDSASEK